jgi:hypothetical protein
MSKIIVNSQWYNNAPTLPKPQSFLPSFRIIRPPPENNLISILNPNSLLTLPNFNFPRSIIAPLNQTASPFILTLKLAHRACAQ